MSELTGFRVAVPATDGFEESELTEPVKALRQAGDRIIILSPKPREIHGVRHDIDKTIEVKVDRTIGDASADEFDAVHLPRRRLERRRHADGAGDPGVLARDRRRRLTNFGDLLRAVRARIS